MIETLQYYLSPYFFFDLLDMVLDFIVLLINAGFDAIPI